jgi:hypothetical protein
LGLRRRPPQCRGKRARLARLKRAAATGYQRRIIQRPIGNPFFAATAASEKLQL